MVNPWKGCRKEESSSLHSELYSFEKWKKGKDEELRKKAEAEARKKREEEERKAETAAKAFEVFQKWKAQHDEELLKRKKLEKAKEEAAKAEKLREEQEKKIIRERAFKNWLSKKKEAERREKRRSARKQQSAGLDAEDGAGLETNDVGASEVTGMKRSVSTAGRKGDAERAFKLWLERKNEARAVEKRRRKQRLRQLERRAKARVAAAQIAYDRWVQSTTERDERDKDLVEKMRELSLHRPPWMPC